MKLCTDCLNYSHFTGSCHDERNVRTSRVDGIERAINSCEFLRRDYQTVSSCGAEARWFLPRPKPQYVPDAPAFAGRDPYGPLDGVEP